MLCICSLQTILWCKYYICCRCTWKTLGLVFDFPNFYAYVSYVLVCLFRWQKSVHIFRMCLNFIRGDQGQNSTRGRINSSTSEQLEVGSKPRVRINSSTSEQLEVGSSHRHRNKLEVGSSHRRQNDSRSYQLESGSPARRPPWVIPNSMPWYDLLDIRPPGHPTTSSSPRRVVTFLYDIVLALFQSIGGVPTFCFVGYC